MPQATQLELPERQAPFADVHTRTWHVSARAQVRELAGAADELVVLLRDLPADQGKGRAKALHAVGDTIRKHLRRLLDAAADLIVAAQSARGRRVLAILGEASEQLSQQAAASRVASST